MNRMSRQISVAKFGILLAFSLLTASMLFAQSAGDKPIPARPLEEAEELLKTGEFDRAIGLIKSVIEGSEENKKRLEEAYLLLAKVYVQRGNYYKFEEPETAELYYKEARQTVFECLQTEGLQHTEPAPASEYPPEVIRFFDEVRDEIFGAFRVVALDPPDAHVFLDCQVLETMPDETLPGGEDIPIGPHMVLIQKEGYEDLTDEIVISAGTTQEREYQLSKKKGFWWYAGRAGAAVIGGTGIYLLTRGDESAAAEDLPFPPDPPN